MKFILFLLWFFVEPNHIQGQVPPAYLVENKVGFDGGGLPAQSSFEMAALCAGWDVRGFTDWCTKRKGASWDDYMDEQTREFCTERGLPLPKFSHTHKVDLEKMKTYVKTGRYMMVSEHGPSKFYESQVFTAVLLVDLDDSYACILDPNFIDQGFEWVPIKEFLKRIKGTNDNYWGIYIEKNK